MAVYMRMFYMYVTANPCSATVSPCVNGGVCRPNNDGTYCCQCLDGWGGKTCDTGMCNNRAMH